MIGNKIAFGRMAVSLVVVWFACVVVEAQRNTDYIAYIDVWRATALEQQRAHGIPAAITMAQALLESGAGRSVLATKANNHFGIKCAGDWKGATFTYDDDRRDECFRRYVHARDSYEDHSAFLLRPRYAMLFKLSQDDYRHWAYGLKTCGYATDPNYPEKLIRIIELYDLQHLAEGSIADVPKTEEMEEMEETVDDAPSLSMTDDHRFGQCNGVKYIVAQGGETYASLAYYLNMYEKTLRRINDASSTDELHSGDRVYLYPKKRRADKQHPACSVHADDTPRSIAQLYGIRLSSLYKMNPIKPDEALIPHTRLRLR